MFESRYRAKVRKTLPSAKLAGWLALSLVSFACTTDDAAESDNTKADETPLGDAAPSSQQPSATADETASGDGYGTSDDEQDSDAPATGTIPGVEKPESSDELTDGGDSSASSLDGAASGAPSVVAPSEAGTGGAGPILIGPVNDSGSGEVPAVVGWPGAKKAKRIASSRDATCVLNAEHQAVCWGTGPSGAGDDVFQQLSGAGSSGNELCGLTLAGTIDCFSGGYAKDMQPTEGTFAEVFASLRMACAQDAAGIVSCWGNPSNLDNLDAPDVPLTGVSFGGSSGCGFTVSGGIECWGNPGLEDDRLLSDRMDYSALYIEGSACGLFGDGQIGCWSLSGTSFLPPDAGWVQVAPGISVMCALHMDGHVACVGNGTDGWAEQGKPRPMDLEFEEISVGEDFGCGITTELDVVCWGGDGGEETNSPAGLKAIALDDLAP